MPCPELPCYLQGSCFCLVLLLVSNCLQTEPLPGVVLLEVAPARVCILAAVP